ncbi:hypothetical protein FYK55_00365 [Roseiconus nitratireducens]|uniref:Uncharacterized protein n=1 Tax=Roseiconus nitratireducens TaxID=2605748 RepID=A0A5M6DLP2_9BACT|nr:hypothetical protein FYK55_00365 [Roseiconus nitratireducens]
MACSSECLPDRSPPRAPWRPSRPPDRSGCPRATTWDAPTNRRRALIEAGCGRRRIQPAASSSPAGV